MSYYGKHRKVGGLWCGPVTRSVPAGAYTVTFEQEFVSFDEIMAVDWDRLTTENVEVLPKGYGFALDHIDYNPVTKCWDVRIRTTEQYWGDVTGYQAEIDSLQETVKAKTQEAAQATQEAREAAAEVQAKAVQVEGLTTAVAAVAAISTELPDALALEMQAAAPEAFPKWEAVLAAGQELPEGRVIDDGGQLYRVEQAVVPQAHQPPHAEGMLAVYRPIVPSHAGTEEDPIPWVYGMDCSTGLYYSYEGSTYRCAGDMKPCTWAPDSDIWQWEVK